MSNRAIVFTNGCFDLIHVGHVSLLDLARSLGSYLFVGLNSDDSVRRIKGYGRPIIPSHHRRKVLAAIRWVDYVEVFDEDTPENLIRRIKPDILVKGEEWKGKEVAGAEFVKSRGGQVIFLPHWHDASTTNIIDRIRDIIAKGRNDGR